MVYVETLFHGRRCEMMKDVDTHFGGIAKGVGEAKIVGRVHLAQLKARRELLHCRKMAVVIGAFSLETDSHFTHERACQGFVYPAMFRTEIYVQR